MNPMLNIIRQMQHQSTRLVEKASVYCIILPIVVLLTGCNPPGVDDMFEGKTQLDQGNIKEAIALFEDATRMITKPARAARAWNYLGLAYHQDGQWIAARDAYLKAQGQDANLAQVSYNLGCLELQTGKYKLALQQFKTYLVLRPSARESLFLLMAQAHLGMGDHGGATSLFENALHKDQTLAAAWNGLGIIQFQKQDYEEAYNYFHTALKQQANYAPAFWNQGVTDYPHLNRPDRAAYKLRKFAFESPASTRTDQAKNRAESLEKQFRTQVEPAPNAPDQTTSEEAPTQLTEESSSQSNQEEHSVSPGDTTTLQNTETNLTSTLTLTNQVETTDIVVTPKDTVNEPPVEVTSVEDTSNNNKPEEQEENIQEPDNTTEVVSTEEDPTNPEETSPTTIQENPVNENDEEKETERPVIVAPSQPGVTPLPRNVPIKPYRYLLPGVPEPGNRRLAVPWFDRGSKAYLREDFDQAIESFEKAITADPSYFEAYFNLGLAALKGGSYVKALPAYEYALAIRPNHRDSHYNLALALQQSGHLRDAARELEAILKKSPDDATVLLRLGDLYSGQLQRPVRTREIYRQLLKSSPPPSEAAIAQRWLRANP